MPAKYNLCYAFSVLFPNFNQFFIVKQIVFPFA